MNLRLSACCAFALVFGLAVEGAAQVRDGAAAARGSASIAGTILTYAEPALPVRRAIVSVNSAGDFVIGKSVVTDDNGRFVVGGLAAGRYNVYASKRGWVGASYGSKEIGRPGTTIALDDGQRVNVSIRLARGCVISGTLLDESGQAPPSGAVVRAMRYTYFNGERRLSQIGGSLASLNDLGQYRLYGLQPGEYYVVASTSPGGPARSTSDLHLTSDVDVEQAMGAVQAGAGVPIPDVSQRSVSLAPVYYPGVSNTAQATPITLRAGEERNGVDFVMPYVAAVRVEGTVTGVDGTPSKNAAVMLLNSDPNAASLGFEAVRNSRTDATGHFTFAEVTPGAYVFSARSGAPPGWGLSDVDVQGDDIRTLNVTLQETFTVSGVVRFEGAATVPPNVRVSLVGQPSPNGVTVTSGLGVNVGADGRFTIAGVSPGRYRLSAGAGIPSPRAVWAVRSSTLGGQDALDPFVEIRQGITDAAIVFTDQLAELNGHAKPATTVILFSTNQSDWTVPSRRILTERAASDGSFVFRMIPPGEYNLATVDDIEPGQWSDPAYLQALIPSTTKITIAEGEKKTVDLRASGG